MKIMTIFETCTPRQSVFDRQRRDTVLNLSDLLDGSLDESAARQFFAENYVTEGMKLLIQKTFDRISGKSEQPAAYLLSQAMGGGKTHSMIALGLLARYPALRSMLGSHFNLDSTPYTVIGFDGRESDYPYGLWGALAEQLGNKDLFQDHYAPLKAPGVSSWVHLLKDRPVVILLDELPPYFNNAKSVQIGDSNLAVVTATALSNLLIAAQKTELSRVVIIISDLSATAYADGTGYINQALDNFKHETNRSVVPIEPVATQGDEIFRILQTRLFERLPDLSVRDEVARRYANAVEKAKQMDLTSESPASFAALIRESYPFHYSLRDLYGRFKANPGFQQTRGLLRLMRTVVANLWESEKAKSLELIHPYDIELNDPDIYNEFSTINPNLTEAVRVDIANKGSSHAEALDTKLGGGTLAQETAKLLYVASLSTAQNPELGLRDSEVIAWLCRPGLDVSHLKTDVLEQLPSLAWYLHVSTDGRLYFKNVRNLAATLHSYVESYNKETRLKELHDYLESLFKPSRGDVYQNCLVLPSWEEVQITADKTTLVVTEPYPARGDQIPLHPDFQTLYDNLEYKNRILFLTGDRDTMDEVLRNAAQLKAIRTILDEQDKEKLSERDPQRTEAKNSEDRININLRSAIQQTYTMVVYPSSGGLRKETIRLTFEGNRYDGEDQIRATLLSVRKFSDDTSSLGTWISKIEERLFDSQNPVRWKDVKDRAASKPQWQLHLPRLLDDVKAYAVKTGVWRDEGDYVRKGPFPMEPTSVIVRVKSRDESTGKATLEIRPVGGSVVLYEYGDQAPSTASERVPNYAAFETDALKITFLCRDEDNPLREALPYTWTNTITLKSRLYEQGGERFLELIARPEAPIFYTTDGSDPRTNGAPYAGPFPIPSGCRLILAVARKDGVESEVMRREITTSVQLEVDPSKPLIWTNKRFHSLPTADAWQLISRLEEYHSRARGITIYFNVASSMNEELSYTAADPLEKTGAELKNLCELVEQYAGSVNIIMDVQRIYFERGQDFLDWVNRDRIPYDVEREVQQ